MIRFYFALSLSFLADLPEESATLTVGALLLAEYLQNNATNLKINFSTDVPEAEFTPKKLAESAAQSIVTKAAVDGVAQALNWFQSKK